MSAEYDAVKTLLSAAKIPASEAEINIMVYAYGQQSAAVELLYAVSDARYADPSQVFIADPKDVDWRLDSFD